MLSAREVSSILGSTGSKFSRDGNEGAEVKGLDRGLEGVPGWSGQSKGASGLGSPLLPGLS